MNTVQISKAFLVVNKNEPISAMDKLNVFTNEKSAQEFMEENEFLSDDGALVIVEVKIMVPINHRQPEHMVYFDYSDAIKKKNQELPTKNQDTLDNLVKEYESMQPLKNESFISYSNRRKAVRKKIEAEQERALVGKNTKETNVKRGDSLKESLEILREIGDRYVASDYEPKSLESLDYEFDMDMLKKAQQLNENY